MSEFLKITTASPESPEVVTALPNVVQLDMAGCESTGDKIKRANPFFRDLCSIMKNKEFKRFYDEYFHSWNDIECMIFYMKLYNTVEYEFEQRYNISISDAAMTYTLNKIMCTPELRKTAFSLFKEYEKDLTVNQTKPLRSLLKFSKK